MKYLIITNMLVLVGLGILLLGSDVAVFQKPAATPASGDPPETHLAELLSAGLGNTTDEARSDALIRAALDGQSLHPMAAEGVWSRLKEVYSKRSGFDRVVGLTIYLNAIEDTVGTCVDIDTFEKLWAIRDDVISERNKAMEPWQNELQKELAAFRTLVEKDGWRKTIATDEGKQKAEQLQNEVQMYEDIAEQTNQRLPDEVSKTATAIEDGIRQRLKQIDKELESERGRDLNKELIEPVEESKTSSRGTYQKLLDRVEVLDSEARTEECVFWLTHLPQATNVAPSAVEPVAEAISLRAAQIWQLQRLRYNLWALRIIYGADDSPQWQEELGVINTGQLDPSVHSLYTMTHDKRLGNETDVDNRTNAVQVLLSKKKVPLEAF